MARSGPSVNVRLWRVLLEDARKVLRAAEAVINGDRRHRLRRLGEPLATALDADAPAVVVGRHSDFSGEQAVEAALAVTELPGDVLDTLILVADILVLGAFAQQRCCLPDKSAARAGIAARRADLPQRGHRCIDLGAHLRHKGRRADHQALVREAGAELAKRAMQALRQVDGPFLGIRHFEERLDLGIEKESLPAPSCGAGRACLQCTFMPPQRGAKDNPHRGKLARLVGRCCAHRGSGFRGRRSRLSGSGTIQIRIRRPGVSRLDQPFTAPPVSPEMM